MPTPPADRAETPRQVEVLDAKNPAATARVRPIVQTAFRARDTVMFWPLSAVFAGTIAVSLHFALNAPMWWIPVLLALPFGPLAYTAMTWAGLTFRVGICPGDQWHVLNTPRGTAVALLKPAVGAVAVEDLAAAPRGIGLGRELGQAIIEQVHSTGRHVTCRAAGKNVTRYESWGLQRVRRLWWLPLVWELRSVPKNAQVDYQHGE